MEDFEEILKKGSKNFHEPYTNLLLNEQGVNYKKIGEEAISRNEVGLLILGGGQGTRLGYDGPKGCYKLKKLNLSLFDIFMSKINQIEKKYGVKLEKYVMTSEYTDEKTREYLKDGVMFVRQRNVQCIDLNKQPVECFSPNGNGGIFQALKDVEFKCKILNVVGVDNILANIIDPVAIGCFIKENYEILSKSVTKRKNEKAGIFVNQNNKLIIKEYDTANDTTEEHEEEAQANIINHFFDTNFFKKSIVLDYHFSRKKLKVVEGDQVKEIEGYKKELFIFDSFIFSQRVGAMNVPRILEFSPLKNGLDKKEYNEYTCVDDFLNAIELNKRIGKMTVKTNKVCLNDLSGLK